MAVDFSSLFQQLKTGVTELATSSAKDYVIAASNDGMSILNELKDLLQLWTQQMEEGKLSEDDFKYNLLSSSDLLEMVALKNEGLAMVKIDRFKAEIINVISTTLSSVIL